MVDHYPSRSIDELTDTRVLISMMMDSFKSSSRVLKAQIILTDKEAATFTQTTDTLSSILVNIDESVTAKRRGATVKDMPVRVPGDSGEKPNGAALTDNAHPLPDKGGDA